MAITKIKRNLFRHQRDVPEPRDRSAQVEIPAWRKQADEEYLCAHIYVFLVDERVVHQFIFEPNGGLVAIDIISYERDRYVGIGANVPSLHVNRNKVRRVVSAAGTEVEVTARLPHAVNQMSSGHSKDVPCQWPSK